jgi:hypothetical protein
MELTSQLAARSMASIIHLLANLPCGLLLSSLLWQGASSSLRADGILWDHPA